MSLARSDAAPSIALRGLHKQFGGRQLLDGFELDIRAGSFTVVLGPSGSGKSTLLRIVAGLEVADRGTVCIGERDVTRLPPQQRDCAMVFQNYALYPHMSVRENLGYALKLARLDAAERARRIAFAAELLGLGELLDRKPAQLSGGQRQRVAIGRAIARRPRVLLFDEPLSNLDARLRQEMRVELRRLHEDIGATTVFVTHDQTEAMTMADRIVVLDHGRIEQIGTPAEVYRSPQTAFVAGFIGTPPMNLLAAEAADGALRLADGSVLVIAAAAATGQALRLGIRPEAIGLDGTGEGAVLDATVAAVEDLGSHRLIHLHGGPLRLRAVCTGPRGYHRGDSVRLTLPWAELSCFDAASGVRVALHLPHGPQGTATAAP